MSDDGSCVERLSWVLYQAVEQGSAQMSAAYRARFLARLADASISGEHVEASSLGRVTRKET